MSVLTDTELQICRETFLNPTTLHARNMASALRELTALRARVAELEAADTSQQPYDKGWQDGRTDAWQAYQAQLAAAERDAAELRERLTAIFPLFEEARDALPAISTVSARLHNVRLDLADRMDDVGDPEKWAKRQRSGGEGEQS
jgi:hypothetical protein